MKTISKIIFFTLFYSLLTFLARSQVTPDHNWDYQNLIFTDDFNTSGRFWSNFRSMPDGKWWAFALDWPAGVTLDTNSFQVYQQESCFFNVIDGTVELLSNYTGHELHCGDYQIPDYSGYSCDQDIDRRFYFSGHMETNEMFHFGYYEIRCKIPIHPGAAPAFWLFGNGPNTYEEIDIFEYSWKNIIPDIAYVGRLFTSGIWYNPSSWMFPDADSGVVIRNTIKTGVAPLSYWHVFGCDWSPSYIRWFLDGELILSYSVGRMIPQYPKRIKMNYSIDKFAFWANWTNSDKMIVDYVRVYKLSKDCNTTEYVNNIGDLTNFQYAVKNFVYFSPTNTLIFPSGFSETFRSVNGFKLSGTINIPIGCTVSFITQACPGE